MMTMVKISDIPITKSIVVYPNPFNANKGHLYITFNGLVNAVTTTVRIYDVTGELIYENETSEIYNGKTVWGCKNNFGNPVASGVYIYLITNSKGDKPAIGKLGIVK
ncbi:MAG: T9SS type A sorting domain-containing protein [bacterium]